MKYSGLLKQITFLILLSGSLCFFSCKREYPDGMDRTIYTLSGTAVSGSIAGSQQIPTGAANATLSGTYNAGTNTLEYIINWKTLSSSATQVTFYGPDRSGNNATLFNLQITAPGVNGTASGTISLYEAQEVGLLSGNWSYVIHNSSYVEGELSGLIRVSPY